MRVLGVGLYLITLLAVAAVSAYRLVVLLVIASPLFLFNLAEQGTVVPWLALLAFWPLLAGLFSLVVPFAPLLPRVYGGRPAEPGEVERIGQALGQFNRRVPVPRQWYVRKGSGPVPLAYNVGLDILIDRPLIDSPYLAATLAHELGHRNTADGRYTLSLARFTMRYPSNGLLRRVLHKVWTPYFREREFSADAYANWLGLGQAFADMLEDWVQPVEDAAPPDYGVILPWLARQHPPAAVRIQRLRDMPPPEVPSAEAERAPRKPGLLSDLYWVSRGWVTDRIDRLRERATSIRRQRAAAALPVEDAESSTPAAE